MLLTETFRGHQETDVGPVCRNFLAPETRSPDAPASHDNSAGFRVGLNVLRGIAEPQWFTSRSFFDSELRCIWMLPSTRARL